jgi:hypothetical protein
MMYMYDMHCKYVCMCVCYVHTHTHIHTQAGKDAVRSVLIAIGIDEACRLRPRAVFDGVPFKV